MKIRPEELAVEGYEKLDELGHMDLIPFVRANLRKRTFSTLFYWGANLVGIAGLVFFFWRVGQSEAHNFWDGLAQAGYGVIFSFLLIPLHEGIHALAYRLVGAQHTSYDANWRQFYFMAIADKFVANRREFSIVALTPFLIISAFFLAFLPLLGLEWQFTVWTIFLTHTSFCAGDFGLLSYFEARPRLEIVTYDDKQNKISYFYGREG